MPSTPASQSPMAEPATDLPPIICNLRSLKSILSDIHNRMNHQVLGNCDVLERMEVILCNGVQVAVDETNVAEVKDKESENLGIDKLDVMTYGAFKCNRVTDLIRSPLRISLGRLRGLQRVVDDIENQISLILAKK